LPFTMSNMPQTKMKPIARWARIAKRSFMGTG
jgi:hypothetical protein